jgi:hypothetical protein
MLLVTTGPEKAHNNNSPPAQSQSSTETQPTSPPFPAIDSKRVVSSGRVSVGIGAEFLRTSPECFEWELIVVRLSPSLQLIIACIWMEGTEEI